MLFDLGVEDDGKPLGFSKGEWSIALDRLEKGAALLNADCRVLLTRNVGGAEDASSSEVKDKELSCTGKVMIRQTPETVQDVIETRIAVVGNGALQRDRSRT